MATGWLKSLQCKSRAAADVVQPHRLRLHSPSVSCRDSVQSLRDVVENTAAKPKTQKPPPTTPFNRRPSLSRNPDPAVPPIGRTRSSSAGSDSVTEPFLAELPEGHPSRNVVEIIFHTSWGKAFSGRVEMVLKVQNPSRSVSRFDEYREMVRSRDGGGGGRGENHARCVADGNEVMGFYCLGAAAGGGAYEAGCGAWDLHGGKGAAVCTYAGSGRAHESAGGGSGRRAMLVCRVIAGRVLKRIGFDPILDVGRFGYDSVSKENGELLVFDTRALLPCFLIIYNKF